MANSVAENTVLQLVQSTVTGHKAEIISSVYWQDVINIAAEQGVLGITFDALESLSDVQRPDRQTLMNWLGRVSYMESCYEKHRKVVEDLSRFYESVGVRMMLLKGYGLSSYWPTPNHRPVGDIDIYLGHLWEYGDQMVRLKLGIVVDNGHHHHTCFAYKGIPVENHYDFINIHSHSSNVEIENTFKTLAKEEAIADSTIANLYYPSDMLNMLFVARHNAIHFASEKMSLRMVLDWAFLVQHVSRNVEFEWNIFWTEVKKMGMLPFVLCMNEICIIHLGFNRDIFHIDTGDKIEPSMVERMLTDIFNPEDTGAEKTGLAYLKHRLNLWFANRWKQKMVYSDTMLSTLFAQVKSHLMKPQTIFGV